VLYASARLVAKHGPKDRHEVTQYWLELGTSFAGLLISFGAYGVVQEFIMTQRYGDNLFPSAAFLMFANRVVIILVSSVYLLFTREALVLQSCQWACLPAVTNSISSWCQHSSLRFITFPTQTVFKNSKIVPTMIMNRVLNGQTFKWQEYVIALVVTACIIGFSISAGGDSMGDLPGNTTIGVTLMLTFILCDALTSTGEKRIYSSYPNFSNMQMMLAVAFFSLLYSSLIVHFTIGFSTMIHFLMENPEALLDVIFLAVCSTIGQYLTYHVIRRFGPVTLSVMMTIRQVSSIYISAILFEHAMGWFSNCCLCIGILAVLVKPFVTGSGGSMHEKPGEIPQPFFVNEVPNGFGTHCTKGSDAESR